MEKLNTQDEITTTKEKVLSLVHFGMKAVFNYCIMNRLDFSADTPDSVEDISEALYTEMWGEEDSEIIKKGITDFFRKPL